MEDVSINEKQDEEAEEKKTQEEQGRTRMCTAAGAGDQHLLFIASESKFSFCFII